jgi:hypothetical protein
MSMRRADVLTVWVLPVVVLAATGLIGAAVLGPREAIGIARSAALTAAIDPLLRNDQLPALAVVELEVDRSALSADGPHAHRTSKKTQAATLHWKGARYPVRLLWLKEAQGKRGLRGKPSLFLQLPRGAPFAPYRQVRLMNTASRSVIDRMLAQRISVVARTATAHAQPVWVRMNGNDLGLMELHEEPSNNFERSRGLPSATTLFYGDSSAWPSRDRWRMCAGADSAIALARLTELDSLLRSATPNVARLAALVDVEAWLNYHVARKLSGCTWPPWLVLSPRSGSFYPVLYTGGGKPWWQSDTTPDPVTQALLTHEPYALRAAQCAEELRDHFLQENGLQREVDALLDTYRSSVLADRDRIAWPPGQRDPQRFSALQYAKAVESRQRVLMDRWRAMPLQHAE